LSLSELNKLLNLPTNSQLNTELNKKADKTTDINAGVGLSGGGDLSQNRTIDLEPATTTSLGGVIVGRDLIVNTNGEISVDTTTIATKNWVNSQNYLTTE